MRKNQQPRRRGLSIISTFPRELLRARCEHHQIYVRGHQLFPQCAWSNSIRPVLITFMPLIMLHVTRASVSSIWYCILSICPRICFRELPYNLQECTLSIFYAGPRKYLSIRGSCRWERPSQTLTEAPRTGRIPERSGHGARESVRDQPPYDQVHDSLQKVERLNADWEEVTTK